MSAFSAEALWAKSKLYVERSLLARDHSDDASFHLWGALALELLGKAALARIHPVLVCDPTDQKSLMHACGVKDPPDKKSITAKTLYERLPQLSPQFDEKMKNFCMLTANRRNAELHSGESPMSGLDPRAWVPAYWRAVSVVLQMQGKSLKEWLGAEEATAVTAILTDTNQLQQQAVAARIRRRRSEYAAKFGDGTPERAEARARSYSRQASFEWVLEADELSEVSCPACDSRAWLFGSLWDSQITDQGVDGDPEEGYYPYETVTHTYTCERFRCSECGLRLEGSEEIEMADLPTEFEMEETREADFGPDYGNE
jgi:hypothetical protein